MSVALGAPPLGTGTEGIEQSLIMDRDEESVLSDSYSNRHSSTADSSIMWGRHLGLNSEQKPRSADHQDKDSQRSSDKTGNAISPRRGTSDMVQIDPVDTLHDTETMTMSTAAPTSVNVCAGMTVASTTAKQSNGTGTAPARHVAEGRCTLLNVDLCRLHPCCIRHL